MGHKMREIESKLVLRDVDLSTAVGKVRAALSDEQPIMRIGSSVDTYWPIHDGRVEGQFLRVRERDGIRQITVKGKDRGSNLDRIEVDVDSTSAVHVIHRMVRCLLGKPAGVIAKQYTVWELESEYDTVCIYELTTPQNGGIFLEVEARSMERMLELEKQMLELFPGATRAPGSLFEMFIDGGKK